VEALDSSTVLLDEGNGDGESVNLTCHTRDGARRVPCFGESVANLRAEDFVGVKIDVFAPSDVVGVEEKRLEFDLILIVNVRKQHRSEGAVEKRAGRKSWICSFACDGEENDSLLLVGKMITESGVEDFHSLVFLKVAKHFGGDLKTKKHFRGDVACSFSKRLDKIGPIECPTLSKTVRIASGRAKRENPKFFWRLRMEKSRKYLIFQKSPLRGYCRV